KGEGDAKRREGSLSTLPSCGEGVLVLDCPKETHCLQTSPMTKRNQKPPAKYIVGGQKVSSTKLRLSKQFRENMTPEEMILWQRLRANRLGGLHFRRQQIIDGFIIDFYCHQSGLVVELDGAIHGRQTDYDAARENVLARRNLRTIRFRNREVKENLNKVLTQIEEACKR
ncbi:MAG TPA: DUF559 domain-containing protein, partial [Candidatus Deferrimicrobium sp.]|nr:DUF559 domain-containing protein [Candidatus Deferrimicrobium sp.]